MMNPQPTGVTSYRVRYHGTGGGLFFIFAKNLLLTIVTLGFYLPWARTERRKFLWQNLEFEGHRFRYHGTGIEMFYGYLKVLAGYVVFFGIPAVVAQFDQTASFILQGVLFLLLLPVIPIAIYGARRYLLSRTSLRGIRFGLDPGAGAFLKKFVGGYLLTIVTLGLYMPVFQNELYAYMIQRTRYGSQAFGYDGTNREAFRIFIRGMLLTLVTLGIYLPWYLAEMSRFRTNHTYIGGARANLDLGGGDIFVMYLVSMFGTLLSLGLAFPWVTTYIMRTIAERTTLVGHLDFAAVAQRPVTGDAAADGFADVLDVGLEV